MKAITKTTSRLIYNKSCAAYETRRWGPTWLCGRTTGCKWHLPRTAHSIWVTVSTRSSRSAHRIWFSWAVRRYGWSLRWSSRETGSFRGMVPWAAKTWMIRHFGAILEDGKPHKFYVSVEYEEAKHVK